MEMRNRQNINIIYYGNGHHLKFKKKYNEDLEKSEILDLIYYGNGHHSGDWLANELS